MSELNSTDNKYVATQQGDGNFVVYLRDGMIPLWDRWSYEIINGIAPVVPIIENSKIEVPEIQHSTPMLVAKGVNPIGMSYWRNINYHERSSTLDVVLSINDELTLFTVDKATLKVIEERQLWVRHTGEGCYFSRFRSDIIYIPFDNSLVRFSTISGEKYPFWTTPNHLWQCHSDYVEQIHSATLRDRNYKNIGWAVYDEVRGEMKIYDIKGSADECQVDKSGRWLLVKEDDYNRIIYLPTGDEHIVHNTEGALGHSDNGFGIALGENDYSDSPGALDKITFSGLMHERMFSTGIWNMGYVSFTNAKPGELGTQNCLVSTPNELILVKLDGSEKSIIVCGNLTQSQEYAHRPKANLCPLGEFAVWTALVDGTLNAYIVRIPEF